MPDGGDATDYPSRILDGAVDVALRSVLFAENEGAGPLSLAFSPGSRVTVADSRFVSNRGARVALARQVAIYLARTRLGLSFTEAGRLFRRDRTTAAHACRRIEETRDDAVFDALIDSLDAAIAGRLAARDFSQ